MRLWWARRRLCVTKDVLTNYPQVKNQAEGVLC